MEGKKFKLGNGEIGLLFGLTAFRYFCEDTQSTLQLLDEVILGQGDIDNVKRNNYWAVFIRSAAKVYNKINGVTDDVPTIEQIEYAIDITDQDEFNKIFEYYLDSSYVGKTMREHYGLVEIPDNEEDSGEEKAKKKRTQSAK